MAQSFPRFPMAFSLLALFVFLADGLAIGMAFAWAHRQLREEETA